MQVTGTDGFDGFVAARYPVLLRAAFALTADRGHAEDLVQSALYRTFLHWDRLRAVEAAESYTHTTMVRLAGRWWRRRWRGEVPTAAPLEDADRPDAAGDSEAGLDLLRALQSLPVGQRAVLVLRYLSDLSEQQTAQILGCSVGTVKSRSNRGMTALREMTWLRADLEYGDTDTEETSHG